MDIQHLDVLKQTHDYYVIITQTFKQRVQWYHEEFEGVDNIIKFCQNMAAETKKKIEEIEPPKIEEKTVTQ